MVKQPGQLSYGMPTFWIGLFSSSWCHFTYSCVSCELGFSQGSMRIKLTLLLLLLFGARIHIIGEALFSILCQSYQKAQNVRLPHSWLVQLTPAWILHCKDPRQPSIDDLCLNQQCHYNLQIVMSLFYHSSHTNKILKTDNQPMYSHNSYRVIQNSPYKASRSQEGRYI